MYKLFNGCKNLIEIDLSRLDASNLKDLDSTFANCSNLKFANLNMQNGQKVESMDNSFTGCQNLENVDFTSFEPKKNISMQNMFKNCANLNYVDLSNFHSYNFAGIFLGCLNIIININIQENSNQDLNTLINNTKAKIECQIGQDAKCKQCMEGKNSIYCDDCNEGYYLPYKKKRTECIKCEDNCLECFGLVTFSYCYKCKAGYESINGKCVKKEYQKEGINKTETETEETYKSYCVIGKEEKCKSCDLIKSEYCSECNEGYYLSEEDKTECVKCSMDGCRACPNNICIDCFNDTEINYPNINDDEEAKRKIMKENNIKPTWSDKIYCNNYSAYLSNGLKIEKHFVWNKYKRKMIEILGIYHINSSYSGIYAYNEKNQSYYIEGIKFNNEYFQSVLQKYEFTFIDHIYEKNQKYYKYNYQTLTFNEIQDGLKCKYEIRNIKNESIEQYLSSTIPSDVNIPYESTESSMIYEESLTTTLTSIESIPSTLIESNEIKCVIGENEKCKSCDLNKPEFCNECNDGYYLSEDDKTSCKKCSVNKCKTCPNDKCLQCFDDVNIINHPHSSEISIIDSLFRYHDIVRYYGIIFCNYKRTHCLRYMIIPNNYFFVWNNYKREMIKVDGPFCYEDAHRYYDINKFNNEYAQACLQEYNFTYQDHIYQKNHKIYQYNNQTLKFDEIEYHENIKSSCEKQTSI